MMIIFTPLLSLAAAATRLAPSLNHTTDARNLGIVPSSPPSGDLPPAEWPRDYDSLDRERDEELWHIILLAIRL